MRQVSPEQARAWNMPTGVGCQFVELSPPAKDALQRVLLGVTGDHAGRAHRARPAQRLRRDAGLLNVRALPLSARQQQQVETILTRVTEARVCLGDPRRRVEYDAWHGNFRGVSAAIDGGVSPDELAELRGPAPLRAADGVARREGEARAAARASLRPAPPPA